MKCSPDILEISETNLNVSVINKGIYVPGIFPVSRKDSSKHMHDFDVYIKEQLWITREMVLEAPEDSFLYVRLSLLESVRYHLFLIKNVFYIL